MKKKNLLIIVITIILILVIGFLIYNKDDKILTTEEALTLGKNKYNELEGYISSILSNENDDFIETTDGYVKYYYKEDFDNNFKTIFSSNLNLNHLFLKYSKDTNTCTSDYININPETCHESISYIKDDGKYYVNSECRSGGFTSSISNLKVTKITSDTINYSYEINQISGSCVDDCEIKLSKNMQLIKENNNWKINKVSIPTRCGYLIDVNY